MDESRFADRLRHRRVAPTRHIPSLAEDVQQGLLAAPRALPPKYFYDDRGSRIFEAICDTPEYYPTRTEAKLLAEAAERIIDTIAPAHLIELGSGSSRKTRYLLSACDRLGQPLCYWPFEVSTSIMLEAAHDLLDTFDWLRVEALSGDYTGGLSTLPLPEDDRRRLFVFLGGTLGNFVPEDARAMLAEIHALMAPGDALLLGLDRVKDREVLEAAYDDAAGHTAAFNRNLLDVLNRALDGNIPVADYRHRACYNTDAQRIEMWLVAERDHHVYFKTLDAGFDMAAGEGILTEISRKFTDEAIDTLLSDAHLIEVKRFSTTDPAYSLILARRPD